MARPKRPETTAARLVDLDAAPRRAEVLRLLGYREGTTRLEAPMRQLLDETDAASRPLARARASLRDVHADAVRAWTPLFARAERVVIGVVTIGAAIEDEAERLVAAREWTRGLLLDAHGSAAVEDALVRVNALVCEEAEARGLVAGRRAAPGYPRWPIEGQQALFDLLGAETAGVELNDAFVMTPRKSISFAIPLGRDLDAESPELGCRYCSMADCAFRRHAQTVVEAPR